MTLPDTPHRREDVVFRPLADDWVLFDPKANQIHVLNLSAALVWTSCTGEASLDGIVKDVEASYPNPPAQAQLREDVMAALTRFSHEGLFE